MRQGHWQLSGHTIEGKGHILLYIPLTDWDVEMMTGTEAAITDKETEDTLRMARQQGVEARSLIFIESLYLS